MWPATITVALVLNAAAALPRHLPLVPAVTIAELVVQEPPGDPIRTAVRRGLGGQHPVGASARVARLGHQHHGLVFGPLGDIIPVIRGLPLAVHLEMAIVCS